MEPLNTGDGPPISESSPPGQFLDLCFPVMIHLGRKVVLLEFHENCTNMFMNEDKRDFYQRVCMTVCYVEHVRFL